MTNEILEYPNIGLTPTKNDPCNFHLFYVAILHSNVFLQIGLDISYFETALSQKNLIEFLDDAE